MDLISIVCRSPHITSHNPHGSVIHMDLSSIVLLASHNIFLALHNPTFYFSELPFKRITVCFLSFVQTFLFHKCPFICTFVRFVHFVDLFLWNLPSSRFRFSASLDRCFLCVPDPFFSPHITCFEICNLFRLPLIRFAHLSIRYFVL